jgi:hypothetical protein
MTITAHCKHCSYELGGYKRHAKGYSYVAVVHHEDCPLMDKARAKWKSIEDRKVEARS